MPGGIILRRTPIVPLVDSGTSAIIRPRYRVHPTSNPGATTMQRSEIETWRLYRVKLFGREETVRVMRPATDIVDAWRCTLADDRPVIVELADFLGPAEEDAAR
jgi:hypothetical protein